ncbi:MAG: hypothetical protein QW815_02550, partial [Nitrososphaerota archaeon]
KFVIKSLSLRFVLIVSADLPLLKGSYLDEAIERFLISGKPALCLVAPLMEYKGLGFNPDHVLKEGGRDVVPVGVNILDGSRIDESELPQENLVVKDVKAFINVNTPDELERAKKLFVANTSPSL